MMESQFNCIPPATGIYLQYIPYSIITNDIKVFLSIFLFFKNGHLNFHNQIRLIKIILWVGTVLFIRLLLKIKCE